MLELCNGKATELSVSLMQTLRGFMRLFSHLANVIEKLPITLEINYDWSDLTHFVLHKQRGKVSVCLWSRMFGC